MAKLTDPTIALAITTDESNGYFHIRARAWTIDAVGKLEFPRYDRATIGGIFLTDFAVTCQGHSARHGHGSDHGRLYAFAHGYEVSMVTADLAPKMARSLATIDRRLAKIAETRGTADTFAEYVTRIAEAIGATRIVQHTGSIWDRSEGHREMTLGDGRYHVARLTAEWSERVAPRVESAAS